MSAVVFTQFLRPDGRPVERHVERPEEIARLAESIITAGGRFEAEVLTTGDVTLTVERGDGDDGPIAMEVCPNGPGVPSAVDRLVRVAAETLGLTGPKATNAS